MIILPRQAQDKHRENSKKDAVFRTAPTAVTRGPINFRSIGTKPVTENAHSLQHSLRCSSVQSLSSQTIVFHAEMARKKGVFLLLTELGNRRACRLESEAAAATRIGIELWISKDRVRILPCMKPKTLLCFNFRIGIACVPELLCGKLIVFTARTRKDER